MRKKKELIQICLDNLDKHFNDGLCNYFLMLKTRGIINKEEYMYLMRFLGKHSVNMESLYTFFCDKRRVKTNREWDGYYWPKFEIAPRREFLQYLINKV